MMTLNLLTFNSIYFMAAFWVVFTFGRHGHMGYLPAVELKQEIQIQRLLE
jgi:hypothetical protein